MPAIDKSTITISSIDAANLLSIALENHEKEEALILLEKMMLLSNSDSVWRTEYLVAYVDTVDAKSKEYLMSQFDPEEGFNILLVNRIKETMKDPDSFEHTDTQFRIENRHVIVRMAYREKNDLGTFIQKHANAGITDNGYMILSDNNLLEP